jgi:Na+-driven multidrug efflux pump
MKTDEYRALVEAGPAVVMVDKEKMLKLLDENRHLKRWGSIYWWVIMIFSVFTLLENAAKSGFWSAGQ